MDLLFKEAYGGLKTSVGTKALQDDLKLLGKKAKENFKSIEKELKDNFGTLVICPRCEKTMMYTGDEAPEKAPLCSRCARFE